MNQIQVDFERDEAGFWVASVPAIEGCHSQGRSIQQVRKRIREAMSLFIDDAHAVRLVEKIHLPKDVRALLGTFQTAREKADVAVETAQRTTQEAAVFLARERKMSVRDIGELLGLSHQRVQQLLS